MPKSVEIKTVMEPFLDLAARRGHGIGRNGVEGLAPFMGHGESKFLTWEDVTAGESGAGQPVAKVVGILPADGDDGLVVGDGATRLVPGEGGRKRIADAGAPLGGGVWARGFLSEAAVLGDGGGGFGDEDVGSGRQRAQGVTQK